MSHIDFTHRKLFAEKGVVNYRKQIVDIHKRKFVVRRCSYSLVNVDYNKCISNFCNYVVSAREKFILSLAFGFSIPYFKYPKIRNITEF